MRSRSGSTARWTASSPRRTRSSTSSCSDGIPAGRIEVVHDGIDVDKIQHRPAIDLHAEYWLPHGVPVIVNVGALVGHKGQKYLIEAMPLVLREVPDAHLVIFGEGELRAPLEKQIKQLSLAKRVLLPGFREDVLSLMKSADLFVMSVGHRGTRLGGARRDGDGPRGRRHARRRHSRSGRAGRDRTAGRAARCEGARRGDRAAVEGCGSAEAVRRSRPRARRRALRRRSARRGNARSLRASLRDKDRSTD